jgi:hypothetical protein
MRSPPCPAGAARVARVAPRGGVGRWRAPIDRGVSLIAETASDESPGPPNASSADRNRSASSERSSRWRSMTARSSSTLTSTRAYPAAPTTRPSSFARGLSRGRAEAASATGTRTAGDRRSSRCRAPAGSSPAQRGLRRRPVAECAPPAYRPSSRPACAQARLLLAVRVPSARGALPVATPHGPRVSRDDHGRRPPRPPGD